MRTPPPPDSCSQRVRRLCSEIRVTNTTLHPTLLEKFTLETSEDTANPVHLRTPPDVCDNCLLPESVIALWATNPPENHPPVKRTTRCFGRWAPASASL